MILRENIHPFPPFWLPSSPGGDYFECIGTSDFKKIKANVTIILKYTSLLLCILENISEIISEVRENIRKCTYRPNFDFLCAVVAPEPLRGRNRG